MAAAPFDLRVMTVRPGLRGVAYLGRILQPRDDAVVVHLVTRVVKERQWVEGTTAAQYVADLRRAVQQPDSRVLEYPRRGGPIAATISRTDRVLPVERQGVKPEQFLAVIYSVDRGVIITGYQFSSLETISIPREASWLR